MTVREGLELIGVKPEDTRYWQYRSSLAYIIPDGWYPSAYRTPLRTDSWIFLACHNDNVIGHNQEWPGKEGILIVTRDPHGDLGIES